MGPLGTILDHPAVLREARDRNTKTLWREQADDEVIVGSNRDRLIGRNVAMRVQHELAVPVRRTNEPVDSTWTECSVDDLVGPCLGDERDEQKQKRERRAPTQHKNLLGQESLMPVG
jgi:hypothetical protein